MKRLRIPRAGRPVKRFVSLVASSRASLSAARWRGRRRRLRRLQVRGADLRGAGAEREGGRDAPAVGDAARGDDRKPNRVDDLRQKREQARLGGDVFAQEHAAMTAGFRPLRDHRVDAALLEPARLGDRRRGGIDLCPSGLDPLEQRLLRQAEMEADDRRLQGLDDLGHRGVERRAAGTAARGRWLEPELRHRRARGFRATAPAAPRPRRAGRGRRS